MPMKRNAAKPKAVTRKDDWKDDTVTKIFLLVIFLIFVFYIPDLWSAYRMNTKVKQVYWEAGKDENLQGDLHAVRGAQYLLVEGTLRSTCTKLTADAHCPYELKDSPGTVLLEGDRSKFYEFSVPLRWKLLRNETGNLTLETSEVHTLQFLPADAESVRYTITDYIPKAGICKETYLNGTICPIHWIKEFPLESVDPLRQDTAIEFKTFKITADAGQVITTLEGDVTGRMVDPHMDVLVFDYGTKRGARLLHKEVNIDGSGQFSAQIEHRLSKLMLSNETYDIPLEERQFKEQAPAANYSVIVLYRDDGFFYAKEQILAGHSAEEKVYT